MCYNVVLYNFSKFFGENTHQYVHSFHFFLFLYHLTLLKTPLFFAATPLGYMYKLNPQCFPTSGETALAKLCSLSSCVYKNSPHAGLTELTQVLPLKSALCALAYTYSLGLVLSDKGVVHILALYVSLVCPDRKGKWEILGN